jgi:DNA-binding protein Fis
VENNEEVLECSQTRSALDLRVNIRTAIREYLEYCFKNNSYPDSLYDHILSETKAPLFILVMNHYNQNQSKTTKRLGISRVTVRSVLKKLGLIPSSK